MLILAILLYLKNISNNKDSKFSASDRVKITKYKNILIKDYIHNGSRILILECVWLKT